MGCATGAPHMAKGVAQASFYTIALNGRANFLFDNNTIMMPQFFRIRKVHRHKGDIVCVICFGTSTPCSVASGQWHHNRIPPNGVMPTIYVVPWRDDWSRCDAPPPLLCETETRDAACAPDCWVDRYVS